MYRLPAATVNIHVLFMVVKNPTLLLSHARR